MPKKKVRRFVDAPTYPVIHGTPLNILKIQKALERAFGSCIVANDKTDIRNFAPDSKMMQEIKSVAFIVKSRSE